MSRSLLVADDSNTIHRVVELTFRDTDFVVDCVSDGNAAVQRLATGKHDVVLADVVMPGADGYELCRTIKASASPVPVLLLAGTFESFDHDQARECGADGCLLKPFDSQTLLDRVSALLAKREAVSVSATEPREASPVEPPAEPPTLLQFEDAQIRAIVDEVTKEVRETVASRLVEDIVPRIAEAVVRQHVRRLKVPIDE